MHIHCHPPGEVYCTQRRVGYSLKPPYPSRADRHHQKHNSLEFSAAILRGPVNSRTAHRLSQWGKHPCSCKCGVAEAIPYATLPDTSRLDITVPHEVTEASAAGMITPSYSISQEKEGCRRSCSRTFQEVVRFHMWLREGRRGELGCERLWSGSTPRTPRSGHSTRFKDTRAIPVSLPAATTTLPSPGTSQMSTASHNRRCRPPW